MAAPNIKNSVYNSKNGRYVLGGTTEVSVATLEWWERRTLARDQSDIVYAIEAPYSGRPDLLGWLFYGDPGLWWVIGQYNTILDPFEELVEGKILLIPTLERVKAQLKNPNVKTGGAPTTRVPK